MLVTTNVIDNLFQDFKDSFIRCLNLTITLGVIWGGEMMLDMKFIIDFIVEYNVIQNEFGYLLTSNVGISLIHLVKYYVATRINLYPFVEVGWMFPTRSSPH